MAVNIMQRKKLGPFGFICIKNIVYYIHVFFCDTNGEKITHKVGKRSLGAPLKRDARKSERMRSSDVFPRAWRRSFSGRRVAAIAVDFVAGGP